MSRIEQNAFVPSNTLIEEWNKAVPVRNSLVAMQWLRNRNITPGLIIDIQEDLRFSANLRRILFKWGEYIQGRAIVDTMAPKYINTHTPKSLWYGIPQEVHEYYRKPFVNAAVLVEGLYDALIVRPLCQIVMTGFGSHLTKIQIDRLIYYIAVNAQGRPLVIWFDSDARSEALSLLKNMTDKKRNIRFDQDVYIITTPNNQDPSNLGIEKARNVLFEHLPASFCEENSI